MKVVLIRHGRVLSDWEDPCDSASFAEASARYDEAPIAPLPPISIPIEKVYVSELPRSAATAAFLTGRKVIVKTSLINEVRIRPFVETRRRLPLWLWNRASTALWLASAPSAPEPLRETRRRVASFLNLLSARGEDCIVVGHGYCLCAMMKAMRRRGFSGSYHFKMRNGEVLEFEKDSR